MAVGLPAKTTYADGDVFSASDINDTNGTLNLVGQTTNFYAGKNKIINGDFRINQRNFTSNTTSGTYNFDRWYQSNAGTTGTLTVTPQTFTPGAAPVAGYEGTNYVRCVTALGASTNTFALYRQSIEDVRTFANQTVTVSFWAKAATGTPKITVELEQNFGSGGSASVYQTPVSVTLNTSWVRYTTTASIASISGKTIGSSSYLELALWLSAGSDFNTRANSIGLQNNTFDIWGVQVESGSTATAFQTTTGTIQGELAACQRYYWRISPTASGVPVRITAQSFSTTNATAYFYPINTFRVSPTSVDYANLQLTRDGVSNIAITSLSVIAGGTGDAAALSLSAASGLSGGTVGQVTTSASNGYLGLSAEL
jgi:hypothetical protein